MRFTEFSSALKNEFLVNINFVDAIIILSVLRHRNDNHGDDINFSVRSAIPYC